MDDGRFHGAPFLPYSASEISPGFFGESRMQMATMTRNPATVAISGPKWAALTIGHITSATMMIAAHPMIRTQKSMARSSELNSDSICNQCI